MNYIYTPFFKGECKTERDWGRGVGRKGGNTFKQEICVEHLLHTRHCFTPFHMGLNTKVQLKFLRDCVIVHALAHTHARAPQCNYPFI